MQVHKINVGFCIENSLIPTISCYAIGPKGVIHGILIEINDVRRLFIQQ